MSEVGAATTYLERLAARSAAVGTRPVPRHRSGSGRAAGGLLAGRRGDRALRGAAPRRGAAVRRRGQAEPRVLRGVRVAPGWAALERVRARIPADVPVIADAQAGGHRHPRRRARSSRYFDALGVDAVTVNPYLGEDAVAGYLERPDRFAYVLCRTSNAGAADLQGLARRARTGTRTARSPRRTSRSGRGSRARSRRWGPGGTVGLVVGATAPEELRAARSIAPGLAVPRPGRRGAGRRASARCSEHGPATAPPAGGRAGRGAARQRVARASPARPSGTAPAGASSELAERLAEAAREWSAKLPVLP